MPTEKTDTENQMALFGLQESPKPVPEKTVGKKNPPAKAVANAKKTKPPAVQLPSAQKAAPPTPPPSGRSGLVPDGDVRLTANMREDLHLRLKIAAAKQRTTIGEIIEELVEKYVDNL